ncbi:MAG: hypothetical protein ACJ75B_08995 [Flavisolibacter sp.]
MSLPDAVPNRGHNIGNNIPVHFMMSLNELIRDAIRKLQLHFNKVDAVIRCETLPTVPGKKEDMVKLLENLLEVIFHSAPSGAKLFLYIDCIEEKDKKLKNFVEGMKYFTIKIHSNIVADQEWLDRHALRFGDCRHLLSAHDGELFIKTMDPAGCSFSLSVPGKFH